MEVVQKIIQAEMLCGICSDLLKQPKTLACAHSFCRDCLVRLHKTSCKSPRTGLQYDMDLDNFGEDNVEQSVCVDNKIECPVCLQITLFSDECSVDSLDTNDELQEKITTLSSEEKIAIKEKLKERQRMIAEGNRPELCELHELQQKSFCTDCNIAVCSECVHDNHAQHQYSEISGILLMDSLSQLQGLVQPACQYVSRADAALKRLTQDSESIESNRTSCKEAILEVFNKVRAVIDEREKSLLTNVDHYIDKKLFRVVHEEKKLSAVKDQLQQSILEIQQLLDDSSSDLTLALDKKQLVDDIDLQEQNIIDIENAISKSMFSSTYVGFRDDDTRKVSDHIEMLITLCELYPDADSGYYSSRIIPVENEDQNLYIETMPRNFYASTCLQATFTKIAEDESVEVFPEIVGSLKDDHTVKISNLKRSNSTPVGYRYTKELKKRHSTDSNMNNEMSVPIRFESLVMPTPILTPERVLNKLTTSKTETVHPCGICMGENNSFIISDVKNHCLRLISSNGKFIGAIGKEGKGSGQFEEPCAVTVNKMAQIFVCQRENPRVQKLAPSGKYIQKLGPKSLRGNNLGEPWGIAVGNDNKLYVTDWDKSCIHIFNTNGNYNRSIGNDDSIVGESLKFPAGIAVNASGNLVVADRGNHCIWLLETDGSILLRIGGKGHGPGELLLPNGVAVHPNGSIIVSESGNNRISVFSSCGKFLKHFGRRGSEPGMFEHPRHICVTTKGDIVVADELNQRLQVFNIL